MGAALLAVQACRHQLQPLPVFAMKKRLIAVANDISSRQMDIFNI
jgi:hypothetical protein